VTDGPTDHGPVSIADPFQDMLVGLDEVARRGFVQRLADGYYEGWRPTRAEVARLLALETGQISEAEYLALHRTPSQPEGVANTAEIGTTTDLLVAADDHTVPDPAAGPSTTGPARHWLQRFRVDCGELADPFRFIAHGLFDAGCGRRGDQQPRTIFLCYELVPPQTTAVDSFEPVFFTAPIRCLPPGVVLQENADDQTSTHKVGPNSVVGTRGPWLLPPDTWHLKFLIYAQSHDGRPQRHPAGVLRVDIQHDQAEWLPVNGRRAARAARKAREMDH